MNAINDPAEMVSDSHRQTAAPYDQEAASTFTLRRTGRKAVKFDGWQLIEAIGSQNRDVWHDLNIYRSVKDALVVELIVRRGLPDHQDMFRVNTFEDLAAAAEWLEAYRPADDVPIPSGLGAVDTALPWAVLHAVQLRQSIERIALDYQSLLSEVFAALDLSDPPDVQAVSSEAKTSSKLAS